MSWQIDYSHSTIEFWARHMMVAKVRGEFTGFDGTIELDEAHPERTHVNVKIDAASIDTRLEARDEHLRSADFLDVAQFPTLDFVSRRVEVLGDNRARLVGDLTIHGVTREVTMDVEYAGQARSPWGTTSAGFSASTTIQRKDWGLQWNQTLETGGLLVGDDIHIAIELELMQPVEVPETVPETIPVAVPQRELIPA
jgi:polyisoprenoid-binding protein YceI